jgi:hypothetical protein
VIELRSVIVGKVSLKVMHVGFISFWMHFDDMLETIAVYFSFQLFLFRF